MARAPDARWPRVRGWVAAGLLGGAAACAPEAELPDLPGANAAGRTWSWRDVLAAALPGEPAADPSALASDDPREREAALAALVTSRAPTCVPTLLAALKDPSEGVATAAAVDLGLRAGPAAWPRLLAGLGPYPVDYDVPLPVRTAEAAALARLGHPGGIEFLLLVLAEDSSLESPRDALPWAETTTLVFPRELALPGVLALLGDDFGYIPNGSVPAREAAVLAMRRRWEDRRDALYADTLGAFDEPGLATRVALLVAQLDAYQLRQVDGSRFILTELGPGVLPFLADGLASESTLVRVHVLEVLERLATRHDAKTRARLASLATAPLLEDAQPQVGAQAARVCAAARVADPLVVALERRREPEVLLAVVDALGATGLPVAAEVLAGFVAPAPVAPDLAAALAGARLALDPAADPELLLGLLASREPDQAYPAIERLVALTGQDHGLTPDLPAAEHAAALERARAALVARRSR